jgi:hypothetical protein
VNSAPAGSVLNPQIVLIFWEDAQSGPVYSRAGAATSPSYGQWIGWTLSMANSPFFSALDQYRGTNGFINRFRVHPAAPIWSGPAPNTFTNKTTFFYKADIQNIIEALIGAGTIPPPAVNDDMLYVVIPPPGDSAQDCLNIGCNDTASYHGVMYERIIIGNPIPGNPGATLAHELSEGAAFMRGININGCSTNGQAAALADVCNNNVTQNGVQVTAYWSQEEHACAVPESYGTLWVNPNRAPGWHQPGGTFPMRQAYGGAGGVVATATDDNAYFYSSSQDAFLGEWVLHGRRAVWQDMPVITGPNAEYAAGGNLVAALPLDTSGVITYNLTTGATGHLGLPPGALAATSLTVTEGGVVVVTDGSSSPWYWNAATSAGTSQWVQFGGPGQEFVAMGTDILSVQTNQERIFSFPGSSFGNPNGAGWQSLGDLSSFGPVARLVASPDVSGWFWGSWGASFMGMTTLLSMGSLNVTRGFGDYAITGASGVNHIALDSNLTNMACSGAGCKTGGWYSTGGRAGRTISGGQMFVAGCDSGLTTCLDY